MNGKRTLFCLQAGRGLAACTVVLFHLALYFSTDPRFWRAPFYLAHLRAGSLSVGFFFVLSGLVMLLAHWKDIGCPPALKRYFTKRFQRIYPIYWIVLLPVLAILYVKFPGKSVGGLAVLLSDITLIRFHNGEQTLGVSWTLCHEVLFYLVFAALLYSRKIGMLVVAAWFAASLAMWLWPLGPPLLSAFYLSPVHLLFLLGMAIGWVLKHEIRLPGWTLTVAGSLGYLLVAHLTNGSPSTSPNELIGAGVSSFVLLLGLTRLEVDGKMRVPNSLVFLGEASYAIYLTHFTFLSVVMRMAYAKAGRVYLPLTFSLLAAAAIGFGIVVHLLIERPMLRWMSKT